MRAYAPVLMLMIGILVITASESSAQGIRQRLTEGARQGGGLTIQRDGDSTDRRQDLEGAIWEFKVMDSNERNESKRTKMTGRVRIKQSSVFAVGVVEMAEEAEQGAAGDGEAAKPSRLPRRESSGGAQDPLNGRLSQLLDQATQEDAGGERIGDMTKSTSSERTFQFDEDDEYPISGTVVVRPDGKRNGVFVGSYDEFADGKKVKRWRFEMRRIEE